MTDIDRGFYAGIMAALAVVRAHGQDTIFDEIVTTVKRDDLFAEAKRSGALRWSGVSDYKKRHRTETA